MMVSGVRSKRSRSDPQQYYANKLARIERTIKGLTPEIKVKEFTWISPNVNDASLQFTQLFNIPEGTGVNERLGDRIRVKGFEIYGNPGSQKNEGLDIYVLRPTRARNIPQYAQFHPVTGGHYLHEYGWTLWQYMGGLNASSRQYVKIKKNFKNPIEVHYQGTEPEKNAMYLVLKNDTGTVNANGVFSCRVYFTDN